MDVTSRLQECFAKLGYFGKMPVLLQSNPSTIFIWEQFMSNVKPRNEVDMCRKNIIINRLQRKSGAEDLVEYPINEIQIYNDLKFVKEKIARIKSRIREKHDKDVFCTEANKSIYLYISGLKEKIEEKKIKLHILKLRSNNMNIEIKEIDEQVNERGLIAVLDEESKSVETVSKLLQNVVDKIEQVSRNQEVPRFNQNKHMMNIQHSVASTRLPLKASYSTIKKNRSNYTRVQKFESCIKLNPVKSLFIESFKENEMNTENIMKGKEGDLQLLDQSEELLPESCFNFREDEEFLMSYRSSSDFQTMEKYNEESFEDYSVNYKSISQVRQKCDYFGKANSDKYVIQTMEEIICGASTRIIWMSLCNLRENLLRNIRLGLESSQAKVRFKKSETSEEDVCKLNYIYVKHNLFTLKSRKIIKQLQETVDRKMADIAIQLGGHVSENRLKGLEMMLEHVKLEYAIQLMQKEVNTNKKTDSTTTLDSLSAKINKTKEELYEKIREIESYMESKDNLMQQLKKCQDDTAICVRRLSKLVCDPVWAEDLTKKLHSKEMMTFRDFPLHYDKTFSFTDKDSFYRDSLRNFIFDQDTPSDILYMITTIVGQPQYPPERIYIDTIKKKHKFQILSSLKFPKVEVQKENYTLHEFREKEKYVDKICETLISNIRSSKTHQVLNTTSRMKLNMELWLNMPFRRFISKERTVEGKTYKDYEEKFDYLRNNSQ